MKRRWIVALVLTPALLTAQPTPTPRPTAAVPTARWRSWAARS